MNQVVTLLLMGRLQTSKCVYAPMDKVVKLSAFHAGDASSNLAGSTTVSMQPPFQEMYAIWPFPLKGLGGQALNLAM